MQARKGMVEQLRGPCSTSFPIDKLCGGPPHRHTLGHIKQQRTVCARSRCNEQHARLVYGAAARRLVDVRDAVLGRKLAAYFRLDAPVFDTVKAAIRGLLFTTQQFV